MNFVEYQNESGVFAVYAHDMYPYMGLVEEVGELYSHFARYYRQDQGENPTLDTAAIEKELGDILWNLSQIATDLDLDLEEIAIRNIEKLKNRKERGTLKGKGDLR